MPIGISTACFFPLETDEALLRLAKAGVRDAEIFLNAQCETQGEILQTLCDIRKEYGMTIHAVHTYCAFAEQTLLFRKYARRLQDGLSMYRGLCAACRALDCDLLVMHGDREYRSGNSQHLNDEEYIGRFRMLLCEMRNEGVRLSQENVVGYRSGQIDQLRMLRDALGDDFYLTFDVKQAVRCGLDPLDVAKEFARNIVHVHLSDHGMAGDCLLPGQGEFPFSALFAVLCEAGSRADYVIEVYRSAFRDENDLFDAYRYIAALPK